MRVTCSLVTGLSDREDGGPDDVEREPRGQQPAVDEPRGARPAVRLRIAGALSIMGVFLRESGITREMSTERDARADGGWNEVHHALGESPHESESDREEAKERESGTRGGASKER